MQYPRQYISSSKPWFGFTPNPYSMLFMIAGDENCVFLRFLRRKSLCYYNAYSDNRARIWNKCRGLTSFCYYFHKLFKEKGPSERVFTALKFIMIGKSRWEGTISLLMRGFHVFIRLGLSFFVKTHNRWALRGSYCKFEIQIYCILREGIWDWMVFSMLFRMLT